MTIPGLTNEQELSDLRERVKKDEAESGGLFPRRPHATDRGISDTQVAIAVWLMVAAVAVYTLVRF